MAVIKQGFRNSKKAIKRVTEYTINQGDLITLVSGSSGVTSGLNGYKYFGVSLCDKTIPAGVGLSNEDILVSQEKYFDCTTKIGEAGTRAIISGDEGSICYIADEQNVCVEDTAQGSIAVGIIDSVYTQYNTTYVRVFVQEMSTAGPHTHTHTSITDWDTAVINTVDTQTTDTNTVILTNTAGVLTYNVNYQDSASTVLTEDASGLKVDVSVDESTLTTDLVNKYIKVKDLGITASQLADNIDATGLKGFNADKVDGKDVNDLDATNASLWTAEKITTELGKKQDWAGYRVVVEENLTGDGVSTVFTLPGLPLNMTFATGGWDTLQILNTLPSYTTKLNGKELYDSTNIFTRNKIKVVSINPATSEITFNFPPILGESFYIYYWYALKLGDSLSGYYRKDIITDMEAEADKIAEDVPYDNTLSEMVSTNVQTAIDEIILNNRGIQFDLLTPTALAEGKVRWNAEAGTLAIGMPGGIGELEIGQELILPDRPRNDAGVDILNGQLVYISGSTGAVDQVKLANASLFSTSETTIAMATEDVLDGHRGRYTTEGIVRGINANFPAGTTLWLSDTVDGGFTDVMPSAPSLPVIIGTVKKQGNANDGEVYVKINIRKDLLNGEITKESTGFAEPENVIVNYNPATKQVTLTGNTTCYWRGRPIDVLVPGWVSPVNPATPTQPYFLYYNGTDFIWSTSYWTYDLVQIAYVYYDSLGVFKFALRETHGVQSWQSHLQNHEVVGTYLRSGGDNTGYVLNSTVVSERRPDTSVTQIKDEDLITNLLTKTDKLYTIAYLTGSGEIQFTEDSLDIVLLNGNQPYWNEFTGGVWQQTLLANQSYTAVYEFAMPSSSDTQSQKYRYVRMQGQFAGTLSEVQARTTLDLNLAGLEALSPEFIFISKTIVRYIGGNWKIISVDKLKGSKANQSITPSGNYISSVATNETLLGNGNSLSPLKLSGIIFPEADSTTSVQVRKADGLTNVVNIDTTNSFMSVGGVTPSAPFHAYGDDTNGWVARIESTVSGKGVYLGERFSLASIGTIGSGNLLINPDGGNVGIGVSNPIGEVSIASESTTNIYRGLNIAQFSDSIHGAGFSQLKARGSKASPTTLANGDFIGGITFFGHDGTNFINSNSITCQINDTVATGDVKSKLIFSNGKMVLDNTGFLGIMPIGITTPRYLIEEYYTLPSGGGLPLTSGNNLTDPNTLHRLGTGSVCLDTGVHSSGAFWFQNRAITDYSVNYPIALNPNGGNVGIGTTTPNDKLVVAGTADVRVGVVKSDKDTGTAVSVYSCVNTGGTYNYFHVGMGSIYHSSPLIADKFYIFSDVIGVCQTIDRTTGNVAIGEIIANAKLTIRSSNNSNSTWTQTNYNSDDTFTFGVRDDGFICSPGTYTYTTATSANVNVDASGYFTRATSSLRYKTEIEDMLDSYSENIYKLRPVWYRSLSEKDNKNHSWWGFIAEELAEIDPRLVDFGYWEEDYENVIEKDDNGFILKNERVLKQDAKLSPVGVMYDRITVLLTKEIQKHEETINKQEATINDLIRRIEALENK